MFGNMTTVTIKNVFVDPHAQTQSGFGFIHFETIEGARAAVNHGSLLQMGGVTYIAEFSKHLLKRGEKKVEHYAPPPPPPPPPPEIIPARPLVQWMGSPPPPQQSYQYSYDPTPYSPRPYALYPVRKFSHHLLILLIR